MVTSEGGMSLHPLSGGDLHFRIVEVDSVGKSVRPMQWTETHVKKI